MNGGEISIATVALRNFPPRTMPEAMMRASWIARFLPGRWATTILALYTDLYRRGFGDACARAAAVRNRKAPDKRATGRDSTHPCPRAHIQAITPPSNQHPLHRQLNTRYRDDALKQTYHGRSIHDVLEMTVVDALRFFSSVRNLWKRSAGIGRGLQLLVDVGVGHLRLGQSLSTLSAAEAQRLKLPPSSPGLRTSWTSRPPASARAIDRCSVSTTLAAA